MSALLTDAELNQMRDLVYDGAIEAAVGTGATAPAGSDAALETEVFRDAVASKIKQNKTLVLKLVLGSQHANGHALRELGIFRAAGLQVRGLPDLVEKTESISVLYTVTIAWGSGA